MFRECLKELVEWKNRSRRKPLVLMGARQVGKTWLMEEFARTEYPGRHVKVNFMRMQSLCRRFGEADIDPAGLIRLLQTATGRRIVPGETLLMLDEIQECPSALTSLKFFCEDMPELAVVAAGSLLGLSYGKSGSGAAKGSFPVGKVERLNVRPMSFAEFLEACGKGAMFEALQSGEWRMVEALRGEYEAHLKDYMVVGGMPEAVSVWAETGSFSEVRKVQRRILADYDDDFKKHSPVELLPKIRLVWDGVPAQLAKENAKFTYSNLKPGARAREYETALEWLEDAGMICRLRRVFPPMLPLSHHTGNGAFKVFMHDVGLLGAKSGVNPKLVLEGDALFAHFKGALTEQYVLGELAADGLEFGYWSAEGGTAEVDFVVEGEAGVIPVEVKSAANTKAKSLGVYLSAYGAPFAVKSSLKNYSESRQVKSLPLYGLRPWLRRWVQEDSEECGYAAGEECTACR